MRTSVAEFPNIQVMHRDAYVTDDGFVFLGCPLWARLTAMSEELSKDPITQEITRHFEEDLRWLKDQIRRSQLPVVIATHYPPTYTMLNKELNSPTSVPFALETESLMRPPVVAWISGYLHESVQIKRPYFDAEGNPGEVLIVSNALGYPDELSHFYRKDAVLRLEKPQMK
jgi:predicted phosphohydrolase